MPKIVWDEKAQEHRIIEDPEPITVYRDAVDFDIHLSGVNVKEFVKIRFEEWQTESEEGRWCTEHAVDMRMLQEPDYTMLQQKFLVRALFEPKDATVYRLKWGNN